MDSDTPEGDLDGHSHRLRGRARLFTVSRAAEYCAPPAGSPTCDAARIDPDSYALATRAQAAIVTQDRLDWWDGFNVGNAFDALHELNSSSTWAAERALELDPHNLLAHGVLARQYVVIGEDARLADRANGGRRSITAAPSSGPRRCMTSTRKAISSWPSIGRRCASTGSASSPAASTRTSACRSFPAATASACGAPGADASMRPLNPKRSSRGADVREIKAGNWVLYFKLTHKVRITSDRGKKADLERDQGQPARRQRIDRSAHDARSDRSVEGRRANDGHRAAGLSGTCPAHAGGVRRSGQAHRPAQGVAQRRVVVFTSHQTC